MKWMPKIKHIDEIKISKLILLLKDVEENINRYEFSEKIDGQNFSIGYEDDEIYTKTKRSPKVLNSKFYEGIPHCVGFFNLHNNLLESEETINNIKNYFNINNFQFFLEILPFSQTNNIDYKYQDKKYAILLDLYTEDESIINILSNNDKEYILKQLNKIDEWIFLSKNIYDIDKLQFHNLKTIQYIYLQYKPILKSRKKCNKDKKRSIQKILKQSQLCCKDYLLEKFKNKKSMLNKTIEKEGIIMRNKKTNEAIKIVDKEKFTEENEKQQGINREIGLENKWFYKEIRSFFNNHDVILNKGKMQEKLNEEILLRSHLQTSKHGFYNLKDILNVILDDIKDEDNFILNEKELLEKLNEIFSKYQNKIHKLYKKWNKKIKSEQAPIPKKVTQRKFDQAFKRIRTLNKAIFNLNSDKDLLLEIQLDLLKMCISDSTIEKLKEKYLWEK